MKHKPECGHMTAGNLDHSLQALLRYFIQFCWKDRWHQDLFVVFLASETPHVYGVRWNTVHMDVHGSCIHKYIATVGLSKHCSWANFALGLILTALQQVRKWNYPYDRDHGDDTVTNRPNSIKESSWEIGAF
jgi:hypothetical protein